MRCRKTLPIPATRLESEVMDATPREAGACRKHRNHHKKPTLPHSRAAT